jgi:predicted transposase/invertase (TIGR01784 family)
MELLHHGHDHFFKYTFANVAVVREHLEVFLPKEVSDNIDFESLERDGTSYVSEALAAHYSDVVWNVNYGRMGIKIAVLFEHKTTPDKYIMLQLLRYMLEIWDVDRAENTDLTLIIPVVVYQGENTWKHYRFEDLFSGIDGVLLRYLPCFTYERTDANERTEAILEARRAYKALLVFQAMRHVTTQNLGVDALIGLLDVVINNANFGNSDDVLTKAILSYIFNYSDVKPMEIIEKVRLLSSPKQENYMSTLNQFYTEGELRGELRGISLGKAEGLLLTAKIIKLYTRGFKAAAIAEKLETELETVNAAIAEYEAE